MRCARAQTYRPGGAMTSSCMSPSRPPSLSTMGFRAAATSASAKPKASTATINRVGSTVGTASPQEVANLYRAVKERVTDVEIGVHLHSRPEDTAGKVLAAYEAGCRRFDGALTGLGGCPFATDELVGNIPTESVLTALAARGVATGFDAKSLAVACAMAGELRERYTRMSKPENAKPDSPQRRRSV